jgi:hypothetical protein
MHGLSSWAEALRIFRGLDTPVPTSFLGRAARSTTIIRGFVLVPRTNPG